MPEAGEASHIVGPAERTGERHFLTFRIDGGLYALPGEDVSEVILVPAAARLPHSPKCLMGLANLRGTVLPLVDPRVMLGGTPIALTKAARAIVLTGAAPAGLVVDRVESLVTVAADRVETRQAHVTAARGEQLSGAFQAGPDQDVAKILDLKSMLRGAFGARATQGRAPRAVAAAQKPEARTETAERPELLVSFDVAGQQFALALDAVREIVPLPHAITIVPRAEAVLLGVAGWRDTLLPLLSLRGLLGFPAPEACDAARKVLVTLVGGGLVGLVADRMRAILWADPRRIDPAPPMLAARAGGECKITAIYRGESGLVSVLAPDQLFREDVMRRLGQASAGVVTSVVAPARTRDDLPFLVFRLGDEEFALPIAAIDEVARVPDRITRVPKTPNFLEGVINLRGEVLPVVDQRRRFDLPPFAGGASRRLIVARAGRHRAGLIVDSVSEVMRVSAGAIEPPPNLTHDGTALIDGVINAGERMILLLNPAELLTRAERGVLDDLDLTVAEQASA